MKKSVLVLPVSLKDGAYAMTQKIRKDLLVFLIVMGTVKKKKEKKNYISFCSSQAKKTSSEEIKTFHARRFISAWASGAPVKISTIDLRNIARNSHKMINEEKPELHWSY